MFISWHGGRRAAQAIVSSRAFTQRNYASRIEIPITPPPVPVIETCPSPTCQCREMPPGLNIDRETNIDGSMAAYAEQILICTGKPDWKSRIEEEDDAALLKQLKANLTRGGKYVDPYHNVLITNSSFSSAAQPATQNRRATQATTETRSNTFSKPGKDPEIEHQSTPGGPAMSAFLLPSFQFVPIIPTESRSVEAFIKAFVLPHKLHNSHDRATREQKNILLREDERQREFVGARQVDEIIVLICGHGGRDERCGKLGPVLQAEFEEKLQRQNVAVLKDAPLAEAEERDVTVEGYSPTARVGLISHIGGHKWAGNVIIYIPPSFSSNPLTGKGIWYGRVAPEHVEGIVGKTILDGKIIKELYRGGINQRGDIIRL